MKTLILLWFAAFMIWISINAGIIIKAGLQSSVSKGYTVIKNGILFVTGMWVMCFCIFLLSILQEDVNPLIFFSCGFLMFSSTSLDNAGNNLAKRVHGVSTEVGSILGFVYLIFVIKFWYIIIALELVTAGYYYFFSKDFRSTTFVENISFFWFMFAILLHIIGII